MISTATAAVNAASAGKPAPSQAPSGGRRDQDHHRHEVGRDPVGQSLPVPLPDWASSTIFAMRASWVSAPTPVALTVRSAARVYGRSGDFIAGANLFRDGLAGQHRLVRSPRLPDTTTPSVATSSPGRTTNSCTDRRVPTIDRNFLPVPDHEGFLRPSSRAFMAELALPLRAHSSASGDQEHGHAAATSR